MWNDLPDSQKNEYKKMILALASLTEMFAQKHDEKDGKEAVLVPIINSKYQETVFQRIFGAKCQDRKNKPYDVSWVSNNILYLIGIKTFIKNSLSTNQKIAQFKHASDTWKRSDDATELAKKISIERNRLLEESKNEILGYNGKKYKKTISIYHLLTRSVEKNEPVIYVRESPYDLIDINNIKNAKKIIQKGRITSLEFNDGKHKYRYSFSDSQLSMEFGDKTDLLGSTSLSSRRWPVRYANDAYEVFAKIADQIECEEKDDVIESYSWKIELEGFSGFNSFYSTSFKDEKAKKRFLDYASEILENDSSLLKRLKKYVDMPSVPQNEAKKKAIFREKIIKDALAKYSNNNEIKNLLGKMFRNYEVYIPIPESATFHRNSPNFFAKGIAEFASDGKKLKKDKKERTFAMTLEPSGNDMKMLLTQDSGKGIRSKDEQGILGRWILENVFHLPTYKPLTQEWMEDAGVNGIRLYKKKGNPKVHFEFVWIDDDNPPKDLWPRKSR